ncbi:MAG: hypothetical protein ACUVT5_01860 [Candidatus Bathyarchaeales archaeon]
MKRKQETTKSRALFSALGVFKTESPSITSEVLVPQTSPIEEIFNSRQAEAERARALGTIYYYSIHTTRTR